MTTTWTTADQSVTSAATCIRQKTLPKVFKVAKFEAGTRNADIGGGKYDDVTQTLARQGIENVIYDPYNRGPEHNAAAIAKIAGGQCDTVTVSNVLNVLPAVDDMNRVIEQAADALKPGGTAYFSMYEGNKSGGGGTTSSGYQQNQPAKWYLPVVARFFSDVRIKRGVIIAKR